MRRAPQQGAMRVRADGGAAQRLRILRPMQTTPTALVATLALLAGTAVHAAELKVYVTTPDGKPAADVVVALLPTGSPAAPLPPAAPALIVQQEIRFVPYVTAVPQGATVRFVNRDRFDHHVRSVAGGPLGSIAPAQEFEFRLKAARGGAETSQDVRFDAPGATTIGCHLHGSMRAHVFASPSPWVAVTDAAGRATLADAPEGSADLRLWHPDQLVAQTQQRLAVSATTGSVQAQLNFSPRARPAPRQPYSAYPN